MAYGDIGAVIDTLEFTDADILYPRLIKISATVCAVIYSGPSLTGWIKTIGVDAAGGIGAAAIDSLEFDNAGGNVCAICHVAGNIYAIAYVGAANTGKICTVEILPGGEIADTVTDVKTFEAEGVWDVAICHVVGSQYVIVYTGSGNDGIAKGIEIGDAGAIDLLGEIAPMVFAAGNGHEPNVMRLNDTIVVIACRNGGYTGDLYTIEIVGGAMGATPTDHLNFNASYATQVHAVMLPGGICAIAYRGPDNDGWISTVAVDSFGGIGAAAIDNFEFNNNYCSDPNIINTGGGICAIVYADANNFGNICTVAIDAVGEIGAAVLDSLVFTDQQAITEVILHNERDIYSIAYRGPGEDGFLKTIGVETLIPARPQHLLTMGIG